MNRVSYIWLPKQEALVSPRGLGVRWQAERDTAFARTRGLRMSVRRRPRESSVAAALCRSSPRRVAWVGRVSPRRAVVGLAQPGAHGVTRLTSGTFRVIRGVASSLWLDRFGHRPNATTSVGRGKCGLFATFGVVSPQTAPLNELPVRLDDLLVWLIGSEAWLEHLAIRLVGLPVRRERPAIRLVASAVRADGSVVWLGEFPVWLDVSAVWLTDAAVPVTESGVGKMGGSASCGCAVARLRGCAVRLCCNPHHKLRFALQRKQAVSSRFFKMGSVRI